MTKRIFELGLVLSLLSLQFLPVGLGNCKAKQVNGEHGFKRVLEEARSRPSTLWRGTSGDLAYFLLSWRCTVHDIMESCWMIVWQDASIFKWTLPSKTFWNYTFSGASVINPETSFHVIAQEVLHQPGPVSMLGVGPTTGCTKYFRNLLLAIPKQPGLRALLRCVLLYYVYIYIYLQLYANIYIYIYTYTYIGMDI